MHHKFLVACHVVSRTEKRYGDDPSDFVTATVPVPVPFAVWTGSANLTANSVRSLENGLVIDSERIAQAYYDEWAQVAAISEPLDWTSEWVAPEWRIGS
jgi:phosphatidylserine/phosphatidylglycerophosphate/cardiolipin synthase-like enzyme